MPDEHCRTLIDVIPFLGLAMAKGTPNSPLMTRLIETAIMSVIAGGFATYLGVKLLEQEMTGIKGSIVRIEASVEKIDNKLERVRSDIYVPRGTNAAVEGDDNGKGKKVAG
jgi:hypothetical protein